MNKLGIAFAALGITLLTAVIFAWPTQWFWNNSLVGAIDGINPIGFWQALGITILCNTLFKNSSNNK